MTQCWSEGELRAWLDGELPARDMECVTSHLKECAACEALRAGLEGRAVRVGTLLAALPKPEPVMQLPRLRPRPQPYWHWAALAVAAAMAIAFLLLPRRAEKVVAVAPRQAPAKPAPNVSPPPPVAVKPAIIRRKLPAKPKPQPQYYVALDDLPIETGVVVRVSLDDGQVPADVILGPDGRPRAIRLVSDISGER